MIFVSLAYDLIASAQQLPASTWDQSLFLLPLQLTISHGSREDLAAYQMTGNEKQVPVYDDRSVSNTLGSRIVLLSTCLSELKSTQNKKRQNLQIIV